MEKHLCNRWRFPQKIRKKLMRFSLLCTLLLVFIAQAGAMAQKITVRIDSGTLDNAFRQIIKQSDVQLVYNTDVASRIPCKAVEFENADVSEILSGLLAGTPLAFRVENGIFIINEKQPERALPQEVEELRITGTVKDNLGHVLPGVTVLVKGTTIGVATDVDGKYELSVPAGNHVLLFSMVGMETQEVKVGTRTEINVVMKEDATELEDVVVTGYFNQAKNSFTGAARTITAEELQTGSNQNILTALQNIDPSFVKVENNLLGSNPNAIPEFQIRGAGSISGMRDEYSGNPNMPVFIVDGFETTAEKVFDMDPYRVASITLLKDAAATAIYGSRASNGVVVITTNAPASGKMAISYNGDVTFYMADLSDYNLCNPEEKLQLEVLAGLYDIDKKSYYTQDKWSDNVWLEEAYNVNTYWLNKPLNKVTLAHKHSLRLDGGNDYIRYAMEVNYNNTPGVMKESGRERLGLGLELQYIYKNFTFRNQLTYSRVKAENSPYGSFSEYTKLNPYVKYKDEDGNLIYMVEEDDRWHPTSRDLQMYNPLYNATLDMIDENRYNDLTNLFGVDWQIIDGLRLKGTFSFTLQNTSADVFKPAKHTDFATYEGDNYDRRGSYTASRGDVFNYDVSMVCDSGGFPE